MEPTIPPTLSLGDLFALITNVVLMISTSLLTLLAVPAVIVLVVHLLTKEDKTKRVTKNLLKGYLAILAVLIITFLTRGVMFAIL